MAFKFFGTLFIVTVGLAISSCSSWQSNSSSNLDGVKPTPTVTSKEVQICYGATAGSGAVLWYAYEKDIFKQYNLKAKLLRVTGGSKAALALITKKADFCQMTGASVVNAALAGQDLVIIASFYKTYLFSLLVNSEIKTKEDLRGKTLATEDLGSASHLALLVALKHLKLNPEQDVQLLRTGDHGERLAAMEAGRVAGTVLLPPLSFKAQEKGYRELLDISALQLPYASLGIVSTKSYLQQNPEIARDFMKAIVTTIALMKSDREGCIEVLAKYLKLNPKQDREILNKTYENLIVTYLPKVPYPTTEGIQATIDDIKVENPKAAKLKPENIADPSFVQELEANGFIKTLK